MVRFDTGKSSKYGGQQAPYIQDWLKLYYKDYSVFETNYEPTKEYSVYRYKKNQKQLKALNISQLF